jgi:hypothetical protein
VVSPECSAPVLSNEAEAVLVPASMVENDPELLRVPNLDAPDAVLSVAVLETIGRGILLRSLTERNCRVSLNSVRRRSWPYQ